MALDAHLVELSEKHRQLDRKIEEEMSRPTADALVAYSQSCTHLSCAVVPRLQENCMHCPCHEGYFDLQSGRPIAGPPRRPLPRIALEVRQRFVYATGVERRTV